MSNKERKHQPPLSVSQGTDGTQITLHIFPAVYFFLVSGFFHLFYKKRKLYVWAYFVWILLLVSLLGLCPLYYAVETDFFWGFPLGTLFLLLGWNDYRIICLLRYFKKGDRILY